MSSERAAGPPRPELGNLEMAKDPVCGMDVREDTAAGKSEVGGKTYYFCSTQCKRSFDEDPAKYGAQGA
jgi:YHS domain-containing protein